MSLTTLLTIRSDGGDMQFPLAPGSYVIGRDASCDVVVPSLYVAGRHARIHLGEGHFSLEDLSGTGRMHTAAGRRFTIPDRVHLGDFTLEVGDVAQAVTCSPLLDTNPVRTPARHARPEGEKAGDTLDEYTLVKPLGEGGFGTVWQASQAMPVRRDVAIKILKPGMDSREVLARFDQERQALARMNHPGIARVFDAGATSRGRPYFVMEWVQGDPLTRHVQKHAASLEKRLRLFMQVCHAVHHAHQKGIIHRDLKPSNILVAEVDGKPTPKVIDFGIAKAASGEKLTDLTVFTLHEQLMGTPAYMSPEQARRIPGDIDTRSDIYSLGVVLYELLTGTTPFDGGNQGVKTGTDDLFQQIQERTPERPSTRIRTLQRSGHPQPGGVPAGASELAGNDLDWIVMRCLEKEPERRYESAAALAEDVEAFLEHRPVTARPPSLGYVAWRFAQRNKVTAFAAAAVLTAIVSGLAFSSVMYLRERDARKLADAEAEKSRQVAAFLKDTLSAVDSSVALGRDTTLMRDILDKTSERIGRELAQRPRISAELRQVIGNTYTDLRVFDSAMTQLAEATRLLRGLHAGDHPELAASIVDYASALEMAGRVKEAEPVAREGLAMWRRLNPPDSVDVADAECLLAWILQKQGRPAEGEAMATHAFQVWRKFPSEPRLSKIANTLATIYEFTGRMKEGVDLYAEELRVLKETFGPEHPAIVNCLDNYGIHMLRLGRVEEAESLLLESLSMGRKFFGDRCPHEDHVLGGLASIAGRRGDLDAQLDYIRQCRDVGARVYPPGHRYWRESQGKYLGTLISQTEIHLQRALPGSADVTSRRASLEQARALLAEWQTAAGLESLRKPEQQWINCLTAGLNAAQASLDSRDEASLATFANACKSIQDIKDTSATWKSHKDRAGKFLASIRKQQNQLANTTGQPPGQEQ